VKLKQTTPHNWYLVKLKQLVLARCLPSLVSYVKCAWRLNRAMKKIYHSYRQMYAKTKRRYNNCYKDRIKKLVCIKTNSGIKIITKAKLKAVWIYSLYVNTLRRTSITDVFPNRARRRYRSWCSQSLCNLRWFKSSRVSRKQCTASRSYCAHAAILCNLLVIS
jgi:hypothetical protein